MVNFSMDGDFDDDVDDEPLDEANEPDVSFTLVEFSSSLFNIIDFGRMIKDK